MASAHDSLKGKWRSFYCGGCNETKRTTLPRGRCGLCGRLEVKRNEKQIKYEKTYDVVTEKRGKC